MDDDDDGGTGERFERLNTSLDDNETGYIGEISDLTGRSFLLGFRDVGDGAYDSEPDRVSSSLPSGYHL
jgi:hypothetical protein